MLPKSLARERAPTGLRQSAFRLSDSQIPSFNSRMAGHPSLDLDGGAGSMHFAGLAQRATLVRLNVIGTGGMAEITALPR
jgi:hypothetical protein